MIDSIKQYMKLTKKPDMSISEFLAGFDTAYNTAVKKGFGQTATTLLDVHDHRKCWIIRTGSLF